MLACSFVIVPLEAKSSLTSTSILKHGGGVEAPDSLNCPSPLIVAVVSACSSPIPLLAADLAPTTGGEVVRQGERNTRGEDEISHRRAVEKIGEMHMGETKD